MAAILKKQIKFPVAAELTIPENKLKELRNGSGIFTDWLKIPQIHGIEYGIGIRPNDKDNDGETWIYFSLLYNYWRFEANVNFEIESANYYDERKNIKSFLNGKKLCTKEELFDPEKRFFIDGKITIKMDGFILIETEEKEYDDTKWETNGNSSDSLSLALWKQENTKDFKIVVGGNEVNAHKLVLATRSPVFARMFESGMKEAKENKMEIPDFSFDVVEIAIKMCYHPSLAPTISLDNKIKLLQFFDKYDIQEFKDNLETYLITVINELTVCRIVAGALLSNATKLQIKCSEFLQKCLHERKPINDFELLDKDFAMKLLKDAFCPVPAYEIELP